MALGSKKIGGERSSSKSKGKEFSTSSSTKDLKMNNQEYDIGRIKVKPMTTQGNLPQAFDYNY